jgi:hypothetical protein
MYYAWTSINLSPHVCYIDEDWHIRTVHAYHNGYGKKIQCLLVAQCMQWIGTLSGSPAKQKATKTESGPVKVMVHIIVIGVRPGWTANYTIVYIINDVNHLYRTKFGLRGFSSMGIHVTVWGIHRGITASLTLAAQLTHSTADARMRERVMRSKKEVGRKGWSGL